jgi:hypothetical protein
VAVYDGRTVFGGTPARLVNDFFGLDPNLRTGITLAAGDFDADGFADIAVAAGVGGGPAVAVFSGKALLRNETVRLAEFVQGDAADRNGARVAVRDLNGDGRADLVGGGGGRVRGYLGSSLVGGGNPAAAFDLDPAAGIVVG